METRFGWPLDQWEQAKNEMRDILIRHAQDGQVVPYSKLVLSVNTIRFDPRSNAFFAMLGEISSEEDAGGRRMLSVLVVHKGGDMKPGPGFFELAGKLGRDTTDVLKCWVDELIAVYAVHQKD